MSWQFKLRPLPGLLRHLVVGIGLLALAVSWATAGETAPTPPSDLETKWGIQISCLRLTAQGHMVDFRYRVIDPVKSATLGKSELKPYLIDQASGIRLRVPRTPKAGQLRQASDHQTSGKIYWMFFGNPGNVVKPGSKVTIVIGDFRVENLMVE